MTAMVAALDGASTGFDPRSAIVLLWTFIGVVVLILLWPRGRGLRLARQVFAVAVLAFREGVRLKVLWTVFVLALIPGALAYYSDADGTHAGRAFVILNYCLSCGEVLGAGLIVLMSAFSVAREIESRIMHTFGTKPIPRWGILVGKAFGFWAIDLLFILFVTLFAAVLVRAVPARAETRETGKLVPTGTWADLHRNALTTRQYQLSDEESGPLPMYKMITPGQSRQWVFTLDPDRNRTEAVALRFQLTSSIPMASHIENLRVAAGYEGAAPILTVTEDVPQERSFDFFLPAKDVTRDGTLVVTLTASDKKGKLPPTQVVGYVRLGVPVDGFTNNMVKAFLLLALQGWILAFITTSWSGVLSFPVTVALGAILVLGGEMSRHALALMQGSAGRFQALGLEQGDGGVQRMVTAQLQMLLQLLPDFRVMGGPTAFVDGESVSSWALAHAALVMGVIRVVGWSLPGVVLFQRREVGR